MFNVRVLGKRCIACGICADVCIKGGIAMRPGSGKKIEGKILTHLFLASGDNPEPCPGKMDAFPCLERAEVCDGCGQCAAQCPVSALDLRYT